MLARYENDCFSVACCLFTGLRQRLFPKDLAIGKEASLGQVFKEIQRQSGYSFWYKTRQLDQAAKVTLDLKNATLEEALRQCFKDQPFDYFIVEQNVVIRPRLVINGRYRTPRADQRQGHHDRTANPSAGSASPSNPPKKGQ
jgi:hypothetical protein